MSKNETTPGKDEIAVGREIFAQIKEYLANQGASMSVDKFPSDFPISRRTCYNIARGGWTPEILAKLPFPIRIRYIVDFTES